MINRSTIKYHLKKRLPKPLFVVTLIVWQKILLGLVESIDTLRLRKFTEYTSVTLSHQKKEFSLFISPFNGFIDKHIFLYGVYEPFMLDLLSLHLKEGMTFVDIGANIGQHSMYAACIVGKKGSVYSFEPIPSLYKQLKESITLNNFGDSVHVRNIALGEKDTEEKLFVSRNIGGSSLVNDDDTQEIITVHVKNGDAELASIPDIHMIKIDVEGYEYEVLRGIHNTLLRHKPILLLEFSGDFYHKQGNGHGAKILALLRKSGYVLFDIEDTMKKVTDDAAFDALLATSRKQTNLLCAVL